MGVLSKMGSRLKLFGSSRQKESGPKKKRVLFVSHEATRTGAPMIILNVLRHFRQRCDIQCETILHNGGHLAGEFANSSFALDCLNIARKDSDDLQKKIRRIVNREKGNTPVLAVCNSMESRFIAGEFARHNIPTISLVHELPSSYTVEDYQNIYDCSQKVVFPVHAVRDAADMKVPIPAGKGLVLPQGLLKPDFGKSTTRQKAYAQIRQELNLPEDAFVVLGCGTLDLRKGIDHFAVVARQIVRSSSRTDRPIHFVWVGDGPRWTHSPYHYVQLDLDKTPARDFVHFIGERENVEPYFVGADCFLMSSRVDPFPCVIHEAMATGLPVITFAGSGGAQEAVDQGAGFVVPYADYDQTSNIIRMLSTQPEVAEGIRERSKERVETRYRFEDYGDKLVDLGESVIGQPLRHSGSQPMLRAA